MPTGVDMASSLWNLRPIAEASSPAAGQNSHALSALWPNGPRTWRANCPINSQLPGAPGHGVRAPASARPEDFQTRRSTGPGQEDHGIGLRPVAGSTGDGLHPLPSVETQKAQHGSQPVGIAARTSHRHPHSRSGPRIPKDAGGGPVLADHEVGPPIAVEISPSGPALFTVNL
jgi:hypothetical protein